jgi:hypothetical protein
VTGVVTHDFLGCLVFWCLYVQSSGAELVSAVNKFVCGVIRALFVVLWLCSGIIVDVRDMIACRGSRGIAPATLTYLITYLLNYALNY